MAVQKKYRGAVRPFYVTLVFVFLLLSGGFYWLAGAINQQQAATADWVSEKLGHEVEIVLGQTIAKTRIVVSKNTCR
jgi:hypothetical protein